MSIYTAYKEEVKYVIEAVPLAVGAGAVDLSGGREKHPGVFVEVWRYRKRFMELE